MNKHILLLSNAYWPSIGGIENSLRHLAQEALLVGDSVEIIVSDIGLPNKIDKIEEEFVEGIKVTRYPLKPSKLGMLNIFYSHYLLYQLLKTKHLSNKNSMVIARFHFSALIASWAGFKKVRYLVPSVFNRQVSQESIKNQNILPRLKQKLITMLHNWVQSKALIESKVFVFSETMKIQCQSIVSKPLIFNLVKPGVDAERFYPFETVERNNQKKLLSLPIDKQIILFVGRFVKAKGVDLLIDACSKLEKDVHLVIIGGGEEKANYLNMTSQLNLDSSVTFVPPLKEVELYYRCADLFVLSSRYEPLGQTLLEAFSSGLRVAAFTKESGADTATEELGMEPFVGYANELNGQNLAKAINAQLILSNDAERFSIAQLANRKFSWATLYQNLIN